MTGPWIVAFAAVAALTVLNALLLLALARYVGALATRLPQPLALELSQGPEVGSPLDAVALPPGMADLASTQGPSGRGGRDALLVFLSTGCSSCLTLVHDLNRFARDHRELAIAAVVSGGGEAAGRMRAALVNVPAWLDDNMATARAFEVGTVPFALLYRAGRLDAKAVVNNRDMLESLMAGRVRPQGDELLQAFMGSPGSDGPPATPARAGEEPR